MTPAAPTARRARPPLRPALRRHQEATASVTEVDFGLVGLSDDGQNLVLALDGAEPGEEGERFELPVDERVRAAARGDARRLGQIDVEIGVTLPPRVIQARIRAGETPEQVAQLRQDLVAGGVAL